MKKTKRTFIGGIFTVVVLVATLSVSTQGQTSGVPCSPAATQTLDGKELPAPSKAIRRHDQFERRRLQALLAGASSSAQGRP